MSSSHHYQSTPTSPTVVPADYPVVEPPINLRENISEALSPSFEYLKRVVEINTLQGVYARMILLAMLGTWLHQTISLMAFIVTTNSDLFRKVLASNGIEVFNASMLYLALIELLAMKYISNIFKHFVEPYWSKKNIDRYLNDVGPLENFLKVGSNRLFALEQMQVDHGDLDLVPTVADHHVNFRQAIYLKLGLEEQVDLAVLASTASPEFNVKHPYYMYYIGFGLMVLSSACYAWTLFNNSDLIKITSAMSFTFSFLISARYENWVDKGNLAITRQRDQLAELDGKMRAVLVDLGREGNPRRSFYSKAGQCQFFNASAAFSSEVRERNRSLFGALDDLFGEDEVLKFIFDDNADQRSFF